MIFSSPRKLIAGSSIFLLLCTGNVIAETLPPLPEGPLLLTSVTPEMLKVDYWISRLPNANQVLKTPAELEQFNKEIDDMVAERVNVFELGYSKKGSAIKNQIQTEYDTVSNRKLFDVNDKYFPKSFFTEQVKPVLGLDQIPEKITFKWAAATKDTSVRALPTKVKMLEEKGDIEFDQLQFTLIKLWTPVVIYHTSSDGAWHYVQAPYVRGWVRSSDIAIFENREELKSQVKSSSYLVITGESAGICEDSECKARLQRASMGTVLPRIGKKGSYYEVLVPRRGAGGKVSLIKGYINKRHDVQTQFPAYTQANFIRQAFKLLGARYGWGGMYAGRDCSGFTFDVFLSMGVNLPRDSQQQPEAGTQLGHFKPYEQTAEKNAALEQATEGLTLIRMPLHIMLYLGEVNGKHYVIHSTWAERTGQDPIKDEKRRINQVVVSDLDLNGKSYMGSLFLRIIAITEAL